MLTILKNFLLCAAMGLAFAVLLIEWASGCGEHYIDAHGVLHSHECVLIARAGQ
jgi:hypothetical protein